MVFFVLALVVAIGVYFNSKDKSEVSDLYSNIRRENCGLHSWVYHSVTEKLTCERCGFVAGTLVINYEDNEL